MARCEIIDGIINKFLRKKLGGLSIHEQFLLLQRFHLKLPRDYGKPSNIIYPEEEESPLVSDKTGFPES